MIDHHFARNLGGRSCSRIDQRLSYFLDPLDHLDLVTFKLVNNLLVKRDATALGFPFKAPVGASRNPQIERGDVFFFLTGIRITPFAISP